MEQQMNISKLLKIILGLSGIFSFSADGGDGGGGALDARGAADAFAALDAPDPEPENAEDAAVRLAAEDEGDAPAAAEEGDEGEQEEVDPDMVSLEVDGKPVTMTKAELAAAIKGQMKDADYRQKTAAAAEATRAAQDMHQKAVAEREKLAGQLHTYTVQTQGQLENIAAQLTDDLLREDPIRYLELERIHKRGQADLTKANGELEALRKQHQAEQAEQMKSYQQSQHQALLDKLPDWKDPSKAKEEATKIQAYLNTQDFSGQELGDMNDHRLVILARKAMLYDGLMERAGKATQRVAAAPAKVERPSVPAPDARQGQARAAQMKKLSQSGSFRDAASLMAGF